ncbi:MAG: universal stress protein [Candidatus Obscuribacterales bacterium]|nr:universal stress protein [Candidatus Obscuribacterales bacterium]
MKIIVAVEDKQFGEAIADFVSQHEWGNDAEFKVIHVVEPVIIPAVYGYPNDLSLDLMEEQRRAGKSLLMSVGTKLTESIPAIKIKEEVLEGYPKEIIIDEAKKWPADLIVLGSHGRRGISQFLLGSVSMSVLSAAPCSVMVVKMPKQNEKSVEKVKQAAAHK